MQDMSSSTRGNAEASDPVEDMSTALSRLTFTPLSAILDALTALSDLDLLPSCSIPVKKRDKARHVALHMRDRNARVAPLTRLPRELLDMILTHALVAVPLEKITIVDGQNARMPPLLRVCHALRDPAAEIWYLNTTFHLKDRPDRGILYRWEFPCPGTAPRLRLDCADSLRDVFWTFYPRSSWLETLEERHRSFIRRLFWDPTRGAQLSGPPNQARLDAVSSRLGLRKGALHVPCQFGSAGMYWLDSLQVSIGPPVDMYTVFLHEVLGRKLVKGSFPTTTNGAIPEPHSIHWYTPWGWAEDSESVRREKKVAVHIGRYDWVVAIQYMDRYCKVAWSEHGKPPPGEEGFVGFQLLNRPGTVRGRLGEQV